VDRATQTLENDIREGRVGEGGREGGREGGTFFARSSGIVVRVLMLASSAFVAA
jgi:hypothetical protein